RHCTSFHYTTLFRSWTLFPSSSTCVETRFGADCQKYSALALISASSAPSSVTVFVLRGKTPHGATIRTQLSIGFVVNKLHSPERSEEHTSELQSREN